MPGAYAHITAVHVARSGARELQLAPSSLYAVGTWVGAAVLGSVSPDYPYMVLHKKDAQRWADLMHYARTSSMLAHGVGYIKNLSGKERELATAWLFGFASHVAMDTTIHPVIERMVGPWKYNKTDHRRCEMHQDVYIFNRLNTSDAGYTDHFDVALNDCTEEFTGKLSSSIAKAWFHMLCTTHPKQAADSPPRIHEWHKSFARILKGLAGTNHFIRCARHVGARAALNFPHDASPEFLIGLPTPEGSMDYDAIFDRAVGNVQTLWKILDDALDGNDSALKDLPNWNLDTGTICGTKKLAFWRLQ